MKKYFLCFLLCGCGWENPDKLTAPITAALGSINTNAQSVLKSGAKPQDARVQTIIKQDQVATKQLTVVKGEYSSAITQMAAKQHRIFIDDCIFGAVALAVLIPILIKLLPFLMAL